MNIKPEDVIVETFKAKHQLKGVWSYEPWVGVRLIHKPTGLSSECEEYKSPHRNKAAALDNLYDKVKEVVQIHTEMEPNSPYQNLNDIYRLHINEEEQALQEYFSEVHNIDITSLKQNVNNLKLKHFEKRVYLFASEYYFKGECFMQVSYKNSDTVILKKWKCK